MDVVKLILPKGDQLEFQIAIVDEPAIESTFMAFNKEAHFQFKEFDKAERKLMGYFMIADMEILRVDPKRGAYKVVFPKESIDGIVKNFAYNGLNRNMNEMHQTGQLAEGMYVVSHFQIDSTKGIKAPDGFKTEADGSWFGIVQCDNDEIYKKALDGTYTGFSIEGKFIEETIDKYFASKVTDIDPKNLNNKFKKMMNEFKELFTALKSVFEKETPAEHKFEEMLLADGTTKVVIEPAVEVGAAIAFLDAEGVAIPAPIGEYELQDGRKIVVEAEGVVASIVEKATEEEEMEGVKSEPAPQNDAVKRLIERIEKVSEYSSQLEKLNKENDALKKESDFLHKENDALKTQFNEFKKATEEALSKLLGEPSKDPVQKPHKGFEFGKDKKTIYSFLKK